MTIDEFPKFPRPAPELKDIDILEFRAELYPDRRRVKVDFQLSAFQTNPNANLTLVNQEGNRIASVNIVNIFTESNEITLHIPAHQDQPGKYQVEMELFYLQEETQDEDDGPVTLNTIPLGKASCSFIFSSD